MPAIFPDFDCSISEKNIQYPQKLSFVCRLPDGTLPVLPGVPSLHVINFFPELKFAGISKFLSASAKESLILNFEQSGLTLQQAHDTFFNKICYFDYPNNELGLVMGLSNRERVIPPLNQKDLEYYEMTEIQYIQNIRSTAETQLLYTQGVFIRPELNIIVHYYPLSCIKKSLLGKLVPE